MQLDPVEQAALEARVRVRQVQEALGNAIYNAMELLRSPDTVVEIRIPKAILDPEVPDKTSVVVGWFDNSQSIADEIATLPYKAEGIYYTINPINPVFISKTKNRLIRGKRGVTDEDIVRRTTLLIDIDAKRQAVSVLLTKRRNAQSRSIRMSSRILQILAGQQRYYVIPAMAITSCTGLIYQPMIMVWLRTY